MNKKEAIIKYISEMNTEMLSLILEDDKSYMDVSKQTFINKLEDTFDRLRLEGIKTFTTVVKGHCGGNCNNGCGGFSFITSNNQSLDLIFVEENNEIKDIYTCTIFLNNEQIENKREIYISFYEDEKVLFKPSARDLALQKQIAKCLEEFSKFKNNLTSIDDFCEWSENCKKLYDEIDVYERMTYRYVKPLHELVYNNSAIQNLITFHPLAKKAKDDFYKLNRDNDRDLIEWVLKYEQNELANEPCKKVKNWKQNPLIFHPIDNSIVLDCRGYQESLQFSEIHHKYYWELYYKYMITSQQFKTAKAFNKNLTFSLETFIKIQEKYSIKYIKYPVFTYCIFGYPNPEDQFIEIAGRELNINIKVEFFGYMAESLVDEKGELKLKQSPEQIKIDAENEVAVKFYNRTIGLNWESKLQNKIKELYLKYQDNDIPF